MDINQLKTQAEGDYLFPTEIFKNAQDAYLLQNDYAGRGSETTAIMTYAYQSYLIRPHNEEVATIMEKIGIVEMHHHEILARLILATGGNPMIGAKGEFWTGANVDYATNLKNMLINDIAAEKRAIEGYEYTIDNLNNKSIVPVIERIIADEKVHIETLEALLTAFEFWQS